MTDPLPLEDGTQALGGTDALAPPPRAAADPTTRPAGGDPLPGIALPALPVATDRDAVARWIDADAAESRAVTDRPVRDAGPVRLLPRDERPAPRPVPSRAEIPRPAPPADEDRTDETDELDDEPEWLRERREEHEFRSQFGEWRSGPSTGPPRPAGGLSPATLGILLVLVVLVLVIALG